MTVAYTVEFHVRSEQVTRFTRLLGNVLDRMRTEESFVSATLHVDPHDSSRFMLHETWRDHEDVVTVQLQRDYRREWHSALPELLLADRVIRVWTPLRSDWTPGSENRRQA